MSHYIIPNLTYKVVRFFIHFYLLDEAYPFFFLTIQIFIYFPFKKSSFYLQIFFSYHIFSFFRRIYKWIYVKLLYFDLPPGPKMLFQGDIPEGSDTFQWPVIERDRMGGLRLMIWDKVNIKRTRKTQRDGHKSWRSKYEVYVRSPAPSHMQTLNNTFDPLQ